MSDGWMVTVRKVDCPFWSVGEKEYCKDPDNDTDTCLKEKCPNRAEVNHCSCGGKLYIKCLKCGLIQV